MPQPSQLDLLYFVVLSGFPQNWRYNKGYKGWWSTAGFWGCFTVGLLFRCWGVVHWVKRRLVKKHGPAWRNLAVWNPVSKLTYIVCFEKDRKQMKMAFGETPYFLHTVQFKGFPVTSAEAVYSNYADSFIPGGNHGGIGHFGSRIGKF